MYLKNGPKYFIKDDARKVVYHSVEASELIQEGWQIEKEEIPEVKPIESVLEAHEELESSEIDFNAMTKAELASYAEDNGLFVRSNATKAELLQACLENHSENG